jgi:acetyltransferase
MFNTAKGFEEFPLPKGNRIAVLTNAGGPAILTVDTLEKNNLELAELTEKTKKRLREIVPPQGSLNNPVDLLPGGTAEQYKQANEILVDDENVDAVISIFVEPVMVPALPVIENINDIQSSKPIFQLVMPLPEFWEEYRKNSKLKRSLFRRPEEPAVVISNLLKFKNKPGTDGRLIANKTKIEGINFAALKDKLLTQEEVKKVADCYNIPIISSKILDFNELKNQEIEFPVVLKAIGEKIIHKSDIKGVVLNIKSGKELISSVEEMKNNFEKKDLEIESFLIQPLINPKFELLVGGFRDPNFGPMVMFGLGGKYVEYFEDTAIRSAYVNENDIHEMINETKIGKIIQGVRSDKAVDMEKIKSTIKSVAQMMINNKEITECDLNPLLVSEDDRIYAVDIRIKC